MTNDVTSTEVATPAAPAKMLRYINTGTQITFVHEGKPYHILRSDNEAYSAAVQLIKLGAATSEKLLEILDAPRLAMLKLLEDHKDLGMDGDKLTFRGYPIHPSLSQKLEACLREGFGAEPFLRFLENLAQNPRRDVLENLYQFLEYGKMALDDEGHFYAYKAVREDFTDIYTGKYDNSIGQVLEMPAWAVDPNRDRTCSTGFHCCSFDYLPHFSHDDGHVMVVRVNPRDVVAIPSDYQNTKMRVCRYEVVDEYKDYYSEERKNVLASRSVIGSEHSFQDELYRLEVDFGDVDGEPLVIEEAYWVQPSAHEIAMFIQEEIESQGGQIDWVGYRLVNTETGCVVLDVKNFEFTGVSDGLDNTYYLLGHPDTEKFTADDDEAVLLGTFTAGNRAVTALIELHRGAESDEDFQFGSFAVFSTPNNTADGLELASRLVHSSVIR